MLGTDHRTTLDALNALDLSDVYSAGQTAHIEQLRHEAALVLGRVAMTHLFADGPVEHDPVTAPPTAVTDRQPFFFRKRLIEYLHERGDLVRTGTSYRPTEQLGQRVTTPETEYFAGAGESPTLQAMKSIESIAGGVFQGRDGLALLEERLGPEQVWHTWQYLMVDAPPKKACNTLVARALDQRLRTGLPTVVFEGGAGLGATLREALQIEGFRERAASNLETYGFTDISRPLMQRARDLITQEAPELLPKIAFDRVDLDALDDYPELGYLQDASADLIIFESVLHDVENLHSVLTSCRRVLKPGGWLAFTVGNRSRPGLFFPCELLQSTLHSYYRAELDPPRRVNVGYLSTEEWTISLTDAGFTDLRIFPDPAERDTWPYGGILATNP
jgi:SAM-dependent methyltransferase